MTIAGSNFGSTQGASTVTFNGTQASPTSWSATSIVAPVPSGATTGNVVVYASGANSNGVLFTVLPPPMISSLSPISGGVGASVTIAGTNFGSTQGTSTVSFNGTLATATNWSATSIAVRVPNGATTGNVVVTANSQQSNGTLFTVVPTSSIYAYERAIVINSAQVQNTDQQNFPVLISGTYPDLASVANGGDVQSVTGYDIIFSADPAGTTLLPFEQETYSPTTGAVNYWVQVPSVSHTTNTTIYMFYGSQSVTSDQSNKTAVWDANYVGVWHLPDGTNLTANDSTSNGNNGVVSGATASLGQIGGGATFDGYSAITVTPTAPLSGSFTIEEWAKPNSSGSALGLYGSRVLVPNIDFAFDANLGTGGVHGDIGNGGVWLTTAANASFPYSANVWHHYVYAVATNSYQIYADGQQIGSGTFSGTPLLFDSRHSLQIGTTGYTDEGFMGTVDEARVSKTVRSADWIATEYNNQNSPGTFAILCPGQAAGTTITPCQPPPPTLAFPQVVQVQPTNGTVPLNARVVVRFAHPAKPGNIVNGTLTVSQGTTVIAGSLALSYDGLSLTFIPAQNLTASTTYSVAVTDVSENQTSPEFQSTFTTGSALDTVAPQIVKTSPQNSSTGIPTNAPVVVQFSKPVDPATVTPQSFQVSVTGVGLWGALQVDPSGLTASFIPNPPMLVNSTVSVSLSSSIKDTSGNSLSAQSFSFTTSFSQDMNALVLAGLSPQNGAVAVPTNGLVVAEFNEPLDPLTVSQGFQLQVAGVSVPGSLALSDGNKRITFTPQTALTSNTLYNVAISTAITDLAGFSLQTASTSTFTTGAGSDSTTPQIVSVSPANNTSAVPTNAIMQVQFSKPVDPVTVTAATLLVNGDPLNFSIPVTGTVSLSADGLTATLVPIASLDSNTFYWVQATSGIQDVEGHALTAFSSYFYTEITQQSASTMVISASPQNGASGVPVNAQIQLLLSEPVSPASVGANTVTLSNGGSSTPGTVSLSVDRTKITFAPTSLLAVSTAYSVVAVGITDLTGTSVAPFSSTFTTSSSGTGNTTQPSVASVSPTNGRTGVSPSSQVVLTFNEPINPISVSSTSVPISVNGIGGVVAGNYALDSTGAILTFTPITPFPGNATIAVAVNYHAVLDLSGNQSPYFGSTFTTAASTDATPPSVVLVTPQNGATGIGWNAPVALTFSKSLNPSTINTNNFALIANGSKLSISISHSADNRVVTLTAPGGALPSATIVTIIATSAVKDLSGNSLTDFTSQFTTTAFDTAHPVVISQRPGYGATGVPLNSSVVLYLSEPMNASTVQGAVHISQNGLLVNGTIQVSDSGQVVQFTPSGAFLPNARVYVVVDSTAQDLDGNSATNYQGSFTTTPDPKITAPTLVSTSPSSSTANIPTNVVMDVSFSEQLDPSSIDPGIVVCYLNQTWFETATNLVYGGNVLQIVPRSPLPANSSPNCQIGSGLKGTNGVAFVGPTQLSFTTGSGPDTVAPAIVSLSPGNGATNVGDNAIVRLVFSKPINPLTVNSSTIQLSGGGTIVVPDSITFSNSNQSVAMTPHAPLPDGSQMTLTINGVTDVAGNPVPAQTIQFTTRQGPDTIQPSVLSASPVNGAGNVAVNAVVVLHVSEPIDPGTVNSSTFSVLNGGNYLAGTYSVSPDGQTITFLPSPALAANHNYPVEIGNMADLAGNTLNTSGCTLCYFTFTTGSAASTNVPQIVGVNPASGATSVPINAQVLIQFNEPVDGTHLAGVSLTGGGASAVLSSTLSNGNQTLTLVPAVPLSPGTTYLLTVTAIEDFSGNTQTSPLTLTFTTGSGADLVAPTVASISPAYNASAVPTNASIQVQFSKAVDPMTVTTATFLVYADPNGAGTLLPVVGTVSLSTDSRTATFTPNQPLDSATYYIVRATNGILDTEGQALTTYQSYFTTAQVSDTLPPSIISLSPSSAAVGATVYINGSYFGASQGSSTVTINGLPATLKSWADAQIVITVPSGATTGPLAVAVNGAIASSNFIVTATRTISAISPSSGPAGTSITITGTNLGDQFDSTTVSFGGSVATPTSGSETSVTATVPANAPGGNVNVTINVDGSTSNGFPFTVIPTPSVTSLSPAFGVAGTSVMISGSNFGNTQGSSTVLFNGVPPASITVWSPNSITAVASSNVTTGPVTVTVNSVPSNANQVFTVNGPAISSLSPPAAAPSAQVNVNGSGFVTSGLNTQVLFNGAAVNIYSFNTATSSWLASNGYPPLSWVITSLTVTVPQGTTSGPVTVMVGTNASNSVQFTVESQPTVTAITPTSGAVGSEVTINGTGFGPTQSNSQITFYEDVPAQVVSWSDTSIQAIVPPGVSTGAVGVQVGTLSAQGPSFQLIGLANLTDSLGNQSSYAMAISGGKWVLANSQGSGCSSCTIRGNTQETADANGNVLTHTDDLGRVTTYTYDANDNVASISRQLDANTPVTTSYTYNSFGEVLTMTDPLGNVTTNAYDANGNLTSVTSPAPIASVTQFAYDSKGELTQITDPLGRPTTLTYTPAGLIATITDAQRDTTAYQYDTRGNRTAVIDPINGASHPTTFAYDVMNRLTAIAYPDGSSVGFGYDSRGRRTSATDQNQKTTTYTYDDADRLVSVTDAANHLTQYAYDTEGNLTSITDSNNHTTYFGYNARGWVTQTTFPSTLFESYGYDADGNLTSKTDRKNQTIQYVYDALNRLTSKAYPDSTSANYVYDLVGKIQQVTDPTGTYAFAYDNMGRLIGTSTQYSFLPGHNFQNSYTYDAASNRTSLTAPDGSTNTYVYDTLNRLWTLTNSLTGQFGFGYDALSRRTQLTRPNGVNTNYNYDSVSHLLSVLHQTGSTTLDGASYTYDYAGNRTSKTNYLNGTTWNYGYDSIYELLQVTHGGSTKESFSYDAVGNRLSSLSVPSYSYNSSNELTATSNGSYTYDANGNTLSDPSGKSYSWDFENRLVSAVVPGTGSVAFKYDPWGRRIYKFSPSFTGIFVYDRDNLIETVNSSGTLLASYTQGQNIDEPLAELRSGGTSFYEADGLGSITSLSTSSGTVANTYSYDSLGNLSNFTGTLRNPFQYTARESDPESGLYYYRARYYDPTIGRFISGDPKRFRADVNFYRYVSDNPTNLVDPWGLEPIGPYNPGFKPYGGYGDSAYRHWPLNGNLWPGFTRQDGVCSTGPLANTMNSRPCVLKCCKAHDDCYTKYNCNFSSFLGGLPFGPCQLCNYTVESCILNADKSPGGGDCKCSK